MMCMWLFGALPVFRAPANWFKNKTRLEAGSKNAIGGCLKSLRNLHVHAICCGRENDDDGSGTRPKMPEQPQVRR